MQRFCIEATDEDIPQRSWRREPTKDLLRRAFCRYPYTGAYSEILSRRSCTRAFAKIFTKVSRIYPDISLPCSLPGQILFFPFCRGMECVSNLSTILYTTNLFHFHMHWGHSIHVPALFTYQPPKLRTDVPFLCIPRIWFWYSQFCAWLSSFWTIFSGLERGPKTWIMIAFQNLHPDQSLVPAPWMDDIVEYCDQCLKVPKSFPFCFFSSKYTIYCGRFCTNNALRHAKLKYSSAQACVSCWPFVKVAWALQGRPFQGWIFSFIYSRLFIDLIASKLWK